MRATVMYRAGDVRIENVPDAAIVHPTDAVIRITRACICGSDLWPYNELAPTETGRRTRRFRLAARTSAFSRIATQSCARFRSFDLTQH